MKIFKMKNRLDIRHFHSHYCYDILAYQVMTSYQWHDVTDRHSIAMGENCHRYTHFLCVYGDFRLNSSFIYSFQWMVHILQYVGRSESTCKSQHKASELAVSTAKGISLPTLYGAFTRIWLLHLALWDAWRSC